MRNKLIIFISLLLLLPMSGYSQDVIQINNENIKINIIHDWDTPFIIEHIDQKMTADEIIDFLTYFFKNMPAYDTAVPPPIDILIESETKAKMTREDNFYSEIKKMSEEYGFRIISMPLPMSKEPMVQYNLRESWKEYKKQITR